MSSTKDQSDEFRKYLENTGMFEVLTKSVGQLYKEQADPKSALTNFRQAIGGSEDDKRDIQLLTLENTRLKAVVKEMEARKAELLARLDRHKANPVAAAGEPMEIKATVATPTVTEPSDAAAAATETQEAEEVAAEDSMETEPTAPAADDTAAETETAAFLQRSKLP